MTATNIIAEIDSSKVLRVTINQEANRNTLSLSVLNSLRDTFGKHAGNDSIRLVALRGAGDKAFAAGGDLKEFSAFRTEEDAARMVTIGKRALDTLRTFPAPVVAFINGLAVGGGTIPASDRDVLIGTGVSAVSTAEMGIDDVVDKVSQILDQSA